MKIKNEITALLNQYEQDVRNKDVEDLLRLHTNNIETFDLMAPFKYSGKELLRDRIEQWFKSYDGEIKFKFQDINVETGEELSICHALIKTSGKLQSGQRSEMWTRSTLGLRKEEGQWRIFHEHTSEPIDMSTGRALTQLDF